MTISANSPQMGAAFDPTRDLNFTAQLDVVQLQNSSPTGRMGWATGAGGAVTQLTNKSTAVTLNTPCGQITMNNASLAIDTIVSFTLTNSLIANTDVLILNHISGGTVGTYMLNAQCGNGSAVINLTNVIGGTLSEAVVIQFVLVKSVKI